MKLAKEKNLFMRTFYVNMIEVAVSVVCRRSRLVHTAPQQGGLNKQNSWSRLWSNPALKKGQEKRPGKVESTA